MRLFSPIILGVVASVALTSCHESLEDRAERESKEFTEKFCPTPPQNGVVTDSIVFNKATKTQTYYLRMTGDVDDVEAVKGHEKVLSDAMLSSLRQNPNNKPYKDAGFTFEYVCRSTKEPNQILLHCKFGPKQYGSELNKKK